jgi:hypothetical protein
MFSLNDLTLLWGFYTSPFDAIFMEEISYLELCSIITS